MGSVSDMDGLRRQARFAALPRLAYLCAHALTTYMSCTSAAGLSCCGAGGIVGSLRTPSTAQHSAGFVPGPHARTYALRICSPTGTCHAPRLASPHLWCSAGSLHSYMRMHGGPHPIGSCDALSRRTPYRRPALHTSGCTAALVSYVPFLLRGLGPAKIGGLIGGLSPLVAPHPPRARACLHAWAAAARHWPAGSLAGAGATGALLPPSECCVACMHAHVIAVVLVHGQQRVWGW